MVELLAQHKEDGVKEIEELCDEIELSETNHVHLLLAGVIFGGCHKVEQLTTTARKVTKPDEEEQVDRRHTNVVDDEHWLQ